MPTGYEVRMYRHIELCTQALESIARSLEKIANPLIRLPQESPMTGSADYTFNHADLVVLTDYMADHGYSPKDISYAVEKPWKHVDLLEAARANEQ